MSRPMTRGSLMSLRRLSGPVAWALMLAWLVPVFLGILPSPATSAERAFYEDQQASLCQGQGQPAEQNKALHSHGECCVLCAAPSLPTATGAVDPLASAIITPAPKRPEFAAIAEVSRAKLAAIVAPITGRGPPA